MKKILPFLFLALSLISCTSEFDQLFNTTRQGARCPKVVFQATTEGPASPDTKVYADESMKVLWNADDRISISLLWCDGNPLATLYMKTGQTISTLNLPEGTSIEYK